MELYYFNVKSIGEGIRLLLAYGGEAWEDKHISLGVWPEFKLKTKFGQLPMLVINGKQLTQSTPIARYLGRKYGLAGATPEEDFEIDESIEMLTDIRQKAAQTYYEPNQEIADKKHEDLVKNFYPRALKKLNEIIVRNNGHLALGKLTWADFMFAGMYEYVREMMRMPDLDSKYPNFKKVFDNVYSIPKVKAYSDKSPKNCIFSLEELKLR